MGEFGTFQVNTDITSFQHGPNEIGGIPKGTYEPKSAEEFAALSSLAGVSFTNDAGESVPYAEMTEEPPAPEPTAPDAAGISAEPALPEPPPGPASAAAPTEPAAGTEGTEPEPEA